MKGEIQLYIGGVPVELTQGIDILFTYSVDELTNPTIVKNSYSKTITIDDTPNNSQLFGQFWNVERIQSIDGEYGTSFNPSKRVPFTIFVNGEIYQEGYAKLMNVKTVGKNNTYEVNLYGGLGSFFYNLSYQGDDNEGDNKKKLSDLRFMADSSTPSESEFDFVIKKETVQEAWNNITADTSSKWHYINFMDSYDGYPDDFDADKVLVNLGETAATPSSSDGPPSRRPGGRTTSSAFIATTSTTDGSYASYDGYVLAELPKERTAAEMREYRSYLLRPVVRVKEIINACCNPENNGGYEVDLDDTFFNEDNPYWEKAWMTLPLLTSMDFNGNEGDDQSAVTVTIGSTTSGGTRTGDIYTETTVFNIGTITANTTFNIAMDLDLFAIMNSLPSGYVTQDSVWVRDHSRTGGMYMSPCGIYPCAYSTLSDTYYPGTICVQLVAYSRDGKVVTGSEVFNCTSGYHGVRTSTGGRGGATQVTTYVPTPNDFSAYTPAYKTTYTPKNGGFEPVNNSSTRWHMEDTLRFVLKKLPKTCTLKLIVSKVNGQSSNWSGERAMRLYQRYYTNYTTDGQGYLNSSYTTAYRNPATINHFEYEISNVSVSLSEGDETIRTGAKFGKADLLNTDYSPAEFFLSYAKLFGLYFEKDKYEDRIYVRTRNTFYRKENVIDLSDKIDHSKTSQITPLVFDAKWYNWSFDDAESQFGEQYQSTYGQPYGIQRVNTGYNFDASEKKLYDGNVFKNGVEALEKSDMFAYVTGNTQALVDSAWKPWMFDSYTYNLYNVNDMEDTVEMEMPTLTKKGSLISYSTYKYYDLFSKLQFHTDDNSAAEGANVLVFFNGSVPTKTINTDQELNYWLTDDNAYMISLNDGQPCWLYTTTATDKGGSSIAIKVTEIPQFSRYLTSGRSGDIQQAWDFGYVKQLFVPNYNLDNASTLYTNYWQSFIRDMYSVDTKKLSCWVKFDERPEMEWLRDFYWYDNSIWRINKIEDYNVVTQDSAKVEFIKVQDVNNYSNVDVSDITGLRISASTTTVTQSGGTVVIYVYTMDDWYVSDYTYNAYSASTSSGHGTAGFTIQIPANKNNYNVVHHINVLGEDGQSAWCQIVQEYANLTVVKEFGPHTNQDIPWSGGTQMYDVRSTYPWTVTNVDNRDYVTLDPISGSGGTLANHFECTFTASDSLAPRGVWMRFTDTQGNYVDVWKWQEACGGLVYQHTGGTKVVQYVSGASAVTPDWLSVVDNGDGTYNVTAIENPDMSARTVNISFTAPGEETKVLEVLQYAGAVFDVTRIDGTGSVLSAGGTVTLAITSNGNWTVSSDSAWCTPFTNSGTTSSTLTVNVGANTDEARKATLTFTHTGGTVILFEVTQNGISTDNFVDPTALVFDATGGTKVFNINTDSDAWQIVGKPSWVTVSPTAGTGTTAVTVTCQASTDWERNGSIVVYNSTKNKTYVVSVQQATGDVFKVARVNGSGDIPAAGGANNICYLEVTSPNKSWTASTSDSFITLDKTSWSASTGLYVTFDQNTGLTRTATINFVDAHNNHLTYSQTQAGMGGQTGAVTPSVLYFESTGGAQTVSVNIDNNWAVVGYPSWTILSTQSGSTIGTIDVTVEPYSGTAQRNGSIVIYDSTGFATYVIAVLQNMSEDEILAVSPSSLRFGPSGGTATLTIISNRGWTIA